MPNQLTSYILHPFMPQISIFLKFIEIFAILRNRLNERKSTFGLNTLTFLLMLKPKK